MQPQKASTSVSSSYRALIQGCGYVYAERHLRPTFALPNELRAAKPLPLYTSPTMATVTEACHYYYGPAKNTPLNS